MNPEYFIPHDDTENAAERDDLVDQYLNQRDVSYDELICQLQEHGGKLIFHDSEQLASICAAFPAGTSVEFSESLFPDDYQLGILVEDTFLMPFAHIGQPSLYRPRLCTTIQDSHGTIDTLLLPIAKHSDGSFEVSGLRVA